MVKLPVVNAARLDNQQKLTAAGNLEEWLSYKGKVQAVHQQMIVEYIHFLESLAQGFDERYFVFSSDRLSLEGWLDLNVVAANGKYEYAVMEIAPWNRGLPREARRHLGVGHELRVFGIKNY